MTLFLQNRPLLESFRRGDRGALAAVYRQFVDDVAGVILRCVREHDRQRDLVQEVFVRAFSETARRSYDGLSPYRPFLLRIAKNLLIDEARRAGRAPLVLTDQPIEPEDVAAASPEEDLEWRTLREATRRYCAALGDTLRRFVSLRFEDEASQRDVAKALGVTRRKVRTWEEEVRQGLRRFLKEAAARPPDARRPDDDSGRWPKSQGAS